MLWLHLHRFWPHTQIHNTQNAERQYSYGQKLIAYESSSPRYVCKLIITSICTSNSIWHIYLFPSVEISFLSAIHCSKSPKERQISRCKNRITKYLRTQKLIFFDNCYFVLKTRELIFWQAKHRARQFGMSEKGGVYSG